VYTVSVWCVRRYCSNKLLNFDANTLYFLRPLYSCDRRTMTTLTPKFRFVFILYLPF
jgi:hypothetical protein